ncbi:MAG TPA: polysaccharide biosynthesis/export family protein [Bryobacterales bacterium]|nr:polysaccharide biosynthesis/export family protein [Bryobacterales bacterium]
MTALLPAQEKDARPARRKAAPSVEMEDKPVTAPKTAPNAVPVEAGVPAFSNYELGPEDLISVVVLDSPEFTREVRVSGAGTIRLPLVKRPIPAAGKTAGELEQEIARVLVEDGLLKEPSVSVTVREFNSKPVSISGAVRTPVVFQAFRPLTLVEAMSRAGGLTESAGSEILVSLPERNGQAARVLHIPTKSLMETGDPRSEIWLRGGEDIRVPQAGRVYILGGVGRPGAVMISNDEPLTLLRALALAGGTTSAAGSKAFLLRPSANGSEKKEEIALNLKKLLKRKEPDLPLQTNDVIFIPDSKTRRLGEAALSAGLTSVIYSTAGGLIWR